MVGKKVIKMKQERKKYILIINIGLNKNYIEPYVYKRLNKNVD